MWTDWERTPTTTTTRRSRPWRRSPRYRLPRTRSAGATRRPSVRNRFATASSAASGAYAPWTTSGRARCVHSTRITSTRSTTTTRGGDCSSDWSSSARRHSRAPRDSSRSSNRWLSRTGTSRSASSRMRSRRGSSGSCSRGRAIPPPPPRPQLPPRPPPLRPPPPPQRRSPRGSPSKSPSQRSVSPGRYPSSPRAAARKPRSWESPMGM
mmetsp:Transcript_3599/g.13456  ORF Transcript_3599/g.13456 Transcript_3599/m.13456 type:complete len:209 (+) Transcript_3599:188-814(+)